MQSTSAVRSADSDAKVKLVVTYVSRACDRRVAGRGKHRRVRRARFFNVRSMQGLYDISGKPLTLHSKQAHMSSKSASAGIVLSEQAL